MRKNTSQLNAAYPPDEQVIASPDRRAHGRQIAMLRLAKVKSGKREGWAFVRNLSASGMMLELHASFELDGTVVVTLSEDQQLHGKIRWRQDASVGVEFAEPIDIEATLKKPSTRKHGQIARVPRVQMKHPVTLKAGARTIDADICDISPTGICVRTDHIFEAGRKVRLMVPQMQDIAGTVRWYDDGRVGIAFAERLSIHNLMTWLSSYYQGPDTDSEDSELPVTDGSEYLESEDWKVPPASFLIFGHDDLGRSMPVATLASADAAIRYLKATSRYFDRVSVTVPGGGELSMEKLVRLAVAEQQQEGD
jgi:acylphosphatase